jgi:hypothetical protein
LEFEHHLHNLIFLLIFCTSVLYLTSSIFIAHGIFTKHWEKSHFTLQLYSLSSITINLFSLTIIIMPSSKCVTQRKIQCHMPYSQPSSPVSCMPRVMSHSPAITAAPVKEWLLSYLVA